MKAILLAAGKGTRISRMIESVPKSTLPINGIPLIRIIVTMLLKEKFDVSVCVGYQAGKIKKALEANLNKLKVKNLYLDLYSEQDRFVSMVENIYNIGRPLK